MARELRILSSRPALSELIACDPCQLQTSTASIQRGQGTLEAGTFINIDGLRALIANQVEGVLSARVYSDQLPDPPEEFSAVTAIYTSGRFLWSAVRTANPGFVFDPIAINTLKSRGLTFEAAYSNNRWIGRP